MLIVLPALYAQVAPTLPDTNREPRGGTPPVETRTGTSNAGSESIRLTPFEVRADSDSSYGALNSNSITRFETELQRLPISADIFTDRFIQDVGATSVEEVIQTYSAGAGYSGTDPSSTGGNTPGDRNSGAFTQLRGLQAPVIMRDGFMPAPRLGEGMTSNYDLERIEVINGPQALLYGAGGAGGVMNLVSKQARLGKRDFGSLKAQINEYGGYIGQIDLGVGRENIAFRVAMLKQEFLERRADIGGPIIGGYVQGAAKLFGHTVARLSVGHTSFDRIRNQAPAFVAQGGANADARNGQNLRYLLATNQLTAAADGRPSGAGVIANGHINWDNVDSLLGWRASEPAENTFQNLSIESQWNRWLSSQLSVGRSTIESYNVNTSYTLFPPSHANNPLREWAIGSTSTNRSNEATNSSRTRALRFSVMASNRLFDGRVTTQTILGADASRGRTHADGYQYYLADNNGSIIVNPNQEAGNGRTLIPAVYWSIQNGIPSEPLWKHGVPQITLNGRTYVRAEINPSNPALVSPANPMGVVFGGGVHTRDTLKNEGVFGANYTHWLQGRLTTLAGFRIQEVYFRRMQTPAVGSGGVGGTSVAEATTSNFNAGVNYKLASWLIPYVSVSSSFNSPAVRQNNPYGEPADVSRARGGEAGIKASNESGTISGSLAWFDVRSEKEQYATTATLLNAINPTGLNGRLGTPNSIIAVDRESRGLQVTLTAAPKSNWRLRFSGALTDGKIGSTTGFDQLYNDQFHTNSQGQVTYADGSVVFVPAAFNASAPTVAAGTPGAVPLTVAIMSTPGNAYYANPIAISGAIAPGSNAARVLQVVDPVRGPILTGRTGLPISRQQINPGFTPIGHIVTSTAGELSVGYPKYSFNLTSLYTFSSGWLKDFQVGGTAMASWENRRYYFYPSGAGTSIGAARELFNFPDQYRFDLIAGYRWKFGRFGLSTQVNVNNLFNRYDVIVLPNALNGWAGPNNATFTQQPRMLIWTNTLTF